MASRSPPRAALVIVNKAICPLPILTRGYGATAARLTPDQKVGSSNLSALKQFSTRASGLVFTTLPGGVTASPWHTGSASDSRARVGSSNPLAPNILAVGKQQFGPAQNIPGDADPAHSHAGCCQAQSGDCRCTVATGFSARSNHHLSDLFIAKFGKGVWRNGSASDSRSEGWGFESLWPQSMHRKLQQVALSGHSVVAKGCLPWWLPSPSPSCGASARALPHLRGNRAVCSSWSAGAMAQRQRV